MRWSELFDDLEAQLVAQETAELQGEVAEHTRAAAGQVLLHERLLADVGRPIHLALRGGTLIGGTLTELARDWLVVHEQLPAVDREVLVVTTSVLSVSGLSGRSDAGRPARTRRSLDLRQALRALSRDRAVVRVRDIQGGVTAGTIDRVGADHLDLSTHPDDLPRRSRDVRSVLTIPYASVVSVSRT